MPNYKQLVIGKNKTKKVTSATDFMAFSVLNNFLAIFFNFFLDIEKFYRILSTCQNSDQLDHSNKNYSHTNLQKALPACLGLIMIRWKENLSEIKIV